MFSLQRKIIGLLAGSVGIAMMILVMAFPAAVRAQDRDRDSDRGERMTRIEPGTIIAVRMNQTVEVDRPDDRIYTGTVDQDVRGENGRLAIPRGSQVELRVRVAPDNDLVLDLSSVTAEGQRYSVRSDATRVEAGPNDNLVGSIVGVVTGEQLRGRTVRVHRSAVLTFRIDRPLEMEAAHHQ